MSTMNYASLTDHFVGSTISESSSVFEGNDYIEVSEVKPDDNVVCISESYAGFKGWNFWRSNVSPMTSLKPLNKLNDVVCKVLISGINPLLTTQDLEKQFAVFYKPKKSIKFDAENSIHITPSPFYMLRQYEKSKLDLTLSCLNLLTEQKYKDISQRISQLVEFSEEEDEDIGISMSSVSQFVNFIIKYDDLPKPSLVFTPNRHIRAKWGRKTPKTLTVDFKGNGLAEFVVFSGLKKSKNVSGNASPDDILIIVKQLEIFD